MIKRDFFMNRVIENVKSIFNTWELICHIQVLFTRQNNRHKTRRQCMWRLETHFNLQVGSMRELFEQIVMPTSHKELRELYSTRYGY